MRVYKNIYINIVMGTVSQNLTIFLRVLAFIAQALKHQFTPGSAFDELKKKSLKHSSIQITSGIK